MGTRRNSLLCSVRLRLWKGYGDSGSSACPTCHCSPSCDKPRVIGDFTSLCNDVGLKLEGQRRQPNSTKRARHLFSLVDDMNDNFRTMAAIPPSLEACPTQRKLSRYLRPRPCDVRPFRWCIGALRNIPSSDGNAPPLRGWGSRPRRCAQRHRLRDSPACRRAPKTHH